MKAYNRVMAGSRSVHANQCFNEGFIGVDYQISTDLTGRLPEDWRDFNREFVPIYMQSHPDKSSGQQRTMYSLRHTYATMELMAGTDIHTLARQMGTSVLMLEKHYSKLTATMAAEQLA